MATGQVLGVNTHDLVVVDNETLGRWHNAVILSTAFTYGDIREKLSVEQLIEERTFFYKFDAKEQKKAGREIEASTVEWWKSGKVTDEARKMSLYPDKERDQPMAGFVKAYERWAHLLGYEPVNTIHMDRNLFDVSKLQHMIEMTLKESHHPWHYHDIMDVVTWLRAMCGDRYGGVDIRKLKGVVYHDPRYDAAVDWLRTQSIAAEFGLIEIRG